jgi:uncharacterized protein involved in response to NO
MRAPSIAGAGERTALMVRREVLLQKLVTVYVVTGLLFMLLPGTFLGVWNLLSISAQHRVSSLPPGWLQAHGHAQIFGWLGTFILGIGFYSLSKMGNLPAFAVFRGWTCFILWSAGVAMRWTTTITGIDWRVLLPLSAFLELAGFAIFFATVSRHRAARSAGVARPRKEAWMVVVIGSTIGFLAALLANLAVSVYVVVRGDGPAVPHVLDQSLLVLPTWGFLVPTVWGFNARWLPTFLGLRAPNARLLYAAVLSAWAAVAAMLTGFVTLSTVLLPVAAVFSIAALGIFERTTSPPKLNGVHYSFPIFVRAAYVWLLIASVLSVVAALADHAGGIWGASRHALTVGFLATMVFSIGPKILPAFCGARILFSRSLMFMSLLLLNVGCALRVCSEFQAYEGYARHAWSVLPVSAVIELAAVTIFALNLILTFLRPPAHLIHQAT